MGLAVAVCSVVIRAVFKTIGKADLAGVLADFPRWAPWALQDVATGVMIAVHTDNRPVRGLRWLEGIAQAAVSMIVAVLVCGALEAAGARTPPREMLLAETGVFGFVLGFLVPSWYRAAPREETLAVSAPRVVSEAVVPRGDAALAN